MSVVLQSRAPEGTLPDEASGVTLCEMCGSEFHRMDKCPTLPPGYLKKPKKSYLEKLADKFEDLVEDITDLFD